MDDSIGKKIKFIPKNQWAVYVIVFQITFRTEININDVFLFLKNYF